MRAVIYEFDEGKTIRWIDTLAEAEERVKNTGNKYTIRYIPLQTKEDEVAGVYEKEKIYPTKG